MLNKIPFHRILALFTLFCVSLTACTPAPALTPTATMPVETPTPSATATASPTPIETPTPAEAPVLETDFQKCAPENFRDCPVTVDDLLNGRYRKWLDTLPDPFAGRDKSKIKITPYFYHDGDILMYGAEDKLDPDPETQSWVMGPTAAVGVSGKWEYAVLPIAFYNPATPDRPLYVITVFSTNNFTNNQLKKEFKRWQSKPPTIREYALYFTGQAPPNTDDWPAVMSYRLHTDMADRVRQFGETGIPTDLSKPGIVIETVILLN